MSTLYGYVVMLQNLKVKFKTDTSGLEWMITDRYGGQPLAYIYPHHRPSLNQSGTVLYVRD